VTTGEFGSICPAVTRIWMWPFKSCGSGNAGTPCERMHLANASSRSCEPIVSPWPASEPLGARLRHARYAARTVGERSSIVEGIWMRPLLSGSGKFGTP
jgi:hypothetical protein